MSFNRSHRPQLSVQSVDLDVEGGRVEDDYDEGWPTSSTLRWSARGPTAHMPTYGLAQSAKIHLKWARAGWADANRWPEALRHILR